MNRNLNRRKFIGSTSLAGAGLTLSLPAFAPAATDSAKPAILGGPKAHAGGFPGWPVYDATEEQALLNMLRSGQWFRGSGSAVAKFEAQYATLNGAKHCLATSGGTTALCAALGALEIGPGDEVIIPPYTFVATYNVVALNYALPPLASPGLDRQKIFCSIQRFGG